MGTNWLLIPVIVLAVISALINVILAVLLHSSEEKRRIAERNLKIITEPLGDLTPMRASQEVGRFVDGAEIRRRRIDEAARSLMHSP